MLDHPGGGRIDLALRGITKVYPGVVALKDVSLDIHGGEVVGVIGENGAGKSTLMKVLGGAIAPDGGRIEIDGHSRAALTPAAAAAHGIAFVHQELNTFGNLDVAGNVLLGRERTRGPFRTLDRRAMADEVRPILTRLGARFAAEDSAGRLTLADQQLLEIARALSMRTRLVIFDEPTSSLTLGETRRLLTVIRQLRDEGVAILFISHRLAEVEEIADRVTVLRDGRNAGDLARDEIDKDRMVRMMIGRDLTRGRGHAPRTAGAPLLELQGVRTAAFPDVPVDLTVRGGEILGLAGLVGAGRTDLALACFGVEPRIGGEVTVAGRPLASGSVAEAIEAGLCLVPEDRKAHGLVLDFAITQNIALPNLARLARRGAVDRRAETALAEDARTRLSIKTAALGRAVAELSGGNQQKVVLAKWLAMDPRVVIFDEPTRGIDVGAKAEVYAAMRRLADAGVAILMISSDMEEVIGVSDRVAVMARGRIAGVLERDALEEEAILRLAVA
ncbi:sugar ABC transporter ATP-binding protein [Wenxinia marina]|uniref:Monosaccharide ABC transporter ATP-binding protein, CUT2 family n=1 Tax=Wenxinia marina DSM 24838 TaxID=1123501 RepID=A0A0D0QDL9_9RHOB|nr:sugar ABC transporter ATP-binding protein [Wenxinia marina]KIQ70432.1 monosaccharide ABC transporter ATP-binding protein, CUT2 family [Wenxinia marina DSM 24838]GGL53191.1 D-ribose transporter ATP-binding protein [Wenxinia marina]